MTGTEFLIVATIFSAGSSVIAGVQAYQQARFQAQFALVSAEFQARIARQNADIALQLGERDAKAALDAAEAREGAVRRDRMRRLSAARAAFGAMGTQLAGTPLEVLSDAFLTAELDAHLVRHQGEVEAVNARLQAQLTARREELSAVGILFSGQGTALLANFQATQSLIAGIGTAGSTLLSGFDEVRFRNSLFTPSGGPSSAPGTFGFTSSTSTIFPGPAS